MSTRLCKLAHTALDIGCGLAAGQTLIIAAPVEAEPLSRAIALAARSRGAADVVLFRDDPDLLRSSLLSADITLVEAAPAQQMLSMARALADGAARITVLAPRPDVLAGIAPDRILRAHRAWGGAAEQARAMLAGMTPQDTAIPFATQAWARLVFPNHAPANATTRLWDALAAALLLDADDPSFAWRTRLADLDRRKAQLQDASLREVRLRNADTDLTLALAQPVDWRGGQACASNGRCFLPGLPAEALSAAVSPEGTHGWVRFSRPLALAGVVVEGLLAVIEKGRITHVSARSGTHAIEGLLAGAAEARWIRRVSLVPANAPAACLGIRFYTPLLDSCSACGLALGPGPVGAAETSALHIDAMFGDDTLQVDGLDSEGYATPVMRGGVFAL